MPSPRNLSEAEANTILLALRTLQHDGPSRQAYEALVADTHAAYLDHASIDELCERLNTATVLIDEG